MLADHPREERSDGVPLRWLLLVVAWVWLLALALFIAA
jgi:hypothetical protein